ncbi:hypothetical protein RTBOTA2_005097 [Rhodotorula toruloides]|nr:hypothetical protein RTBOTA2_005097 [Rhodotorula toruloides]
MTLRQPSLPSFLIALTLRTSPTHTQWRTDDQRPQEGSTRLSLDSDTAWLPSCLAPRCGSSSSTAHDKTDLSSSA